MTTLQISLSGDAKLLATLRGLEKKHAKAVVRKASRKAAKPIVAAARANAPVKTGALRKSIKVRAIKRSRSRIGVRIGTSGHESAFVGKQFYGAFQEYGWFTGKRTKETRRAQAKNAQHKMRLEAKLAREAKGQNRKFNHGSHFMLRAAKSKASEAVGIFATEAAKEITALAKT